MIGFSTYDTPVNTTPTTAELVAGLSSAQRLAVLNGFIAKTPPIELKHATGVATAVIRHLYAAIDRVEEYCRGVMRNSDPPTGIVALRGLVNTEFASEFTAGQSSAIANSMVLWSKSTGDGDFAYYAENVKK